MQTKFKYLLFVIVSFFVLPCVVNAADVQFEEVEYIDDANDDISAEAIEDYNVEGSLFQQITDLEQEKVLMQLEKERAQLNLDLDRLAAEKIKLQMEIDTLSGRAEQQQQEFETERARLETEAKRLELEKEAMQSIQDGPTVIQQKQTQTTSSVSESDTASDVSIDKKYKLVNVFGAGAQLQATIQDLSNGQNKRLTVGKLLDGYVVKSISVDEGVVFSKGGEIQTLNVGSGN